MLIPVEMVTSLTKITSNASNVITHVLHAMDLAIINVKAVLLDIS